MIFGNDLPPVSRCDKDTLFEGMVDRVPATQFYLISSVSGKKLNHANQ
jgi:hypothetical protein